MSADATTIVDSGSSPEVLSAAAEPAINPVLDQAVKAKDFAAFRAEKDAERREAVTGKREARTPTEAKSDPSEQAAKQPDQDAAAKPQPARGKEKRIPQLDADIQERLRRRAEIQREIDREEGRLSALRQQGAPKDEKPAASSPAKAPVGDGRPTLAQFEADPDQYPDPFLAYTEALAEWKADRVYERREAERLAAERRTQVEQSVFESAKRFKDRIDKAIEADPEALSSLDQRILDLKPLSHMTPEERQHANPLNALADVFIGSDDPVGIMRYFSDRPEEVVRVCRMQPEQFFKEVGRIEARLAAAGSSAAPQAETTPAPRTTAPKPPTTLGQRPAESGDPLESAVKRKDFAAYQQAKRHQRMAELGLTR